MVQSRLYRAAPFEERGSKWIGNGVRTRRLRRLLSFLGVPLAAASAVVVLTAAPAHAGALTYHGTFRFSNGTSCLEVQSAGRTDRTRIIAGSCDAEPNERWAIFRDEDRAVYWILAYGGEWPLNKCMDGPDSDSRSSTSTAAMVAISRDGCCR